MFELSILDKSGDVLRRMEIASRRRYRIGRALECEIRIPAATVSRNHAEIVLDEDEEIWLFRDLGSTHGSLVDGQRVTEMELDDELDIVVGPVTLRFNDLARKIGAELNDLLGDDDDEADSADSVEVRIISRAGETITPADRTQA
jgi:pSer/pThr/pTyr-binding forkhead associated (FHA) protein